MTLGGGLCLSPAQRGTPSTASSLVMMGVEATGEDAEGCSRATKSSVSAERDGEAGTADVILDGEGQGRWIPRKVGGTMVRGSSRAFESIRAYQSSREDVKSTRGRAEVALRQRPAVANPLAGLSMWTSGNGTCLASTPTSCASRSRLERPRTIPTSIPGCYTRSPPKAENCLSTIRHVFILHCFIKCLRIRSLQRLNEEVVSAPPRPTCVGARVQADLELASLERAALPH
jgi:hypothetical protein